MCVCIRQPIALAITGDVVNHRSCWGMDKGSLCFWGCRSGWRVSPQMTLHVLRCEESIHRESGPSMNANSWGESNFCIYQGAHCFNSPKVFHFKYLCFYKYLSTCLSIIYASISIYTNKYIRINRIDYNIKYKLIKIGK